MEVECPGPECGFTGPKQSVEAHISGKSDEWHKGKTGLDFRDELGDRNSNISETELGEQDLAEAKPEAKPTVEQWGEEVEEDLPDVEAGDEEEAEGGPPPAAQRSEQPADRSDDEDSSGGIPLPVDSTMLVVGVVAVALMVLLISSRSSSSSGSESSDDQEASDQEESSQQNDVALLG